MALTRGRVIKAPPGAATQADAPLLAPGPSRAQARRIPAAAVDEFMRANRSLDAAKGMADAIVKQAWADAAAVAASASAKAREDAESKVAAAWLELRAREEAAAARDLDRAVKLATALAERLVGASIALEPKVVASLAREALAEARGARKVVFEACPADVDALRTELASIPLPAEAIELRADSSLARGDLRLHTDIGTLDAKLRPRLERLAAALRDALR